MKKKIKTFAKTIKPNKTFITIMINWIILEISLNLAILITDLKIGDVGLVYVLDFIGITLILSVGAILTGVIIKLLYRPRKDK